MFTNPKYVYPDFCRICWAEAKRKVPVLIYGHPNGGTAVLIPFDVDPKGGDHMKKYHPNRRYPQ
jgi:hypothetical protein